MNESEKKVIFKNPLFINPIVTNQFFDGPFVADSRIGHTMPSGKDFIGEKEYVDMELLIQNIKKSDKQIILNIGDSSTSGWDSNIVTQNRERATHHLPLLPAFFQYKTYSDYLRDKLGSEYIVINAGVPAHTSLQGNIRLSLLLKRFDEEDLQISWVSVYYGNNDSVWDGYRQDKEWVGKDSIIMHKNKPVDSIIMRVSVSDYEANLREIIQKCYDRKINVILIEPQTPIYWQPGTRVLNEELERRDGSGAKQIYRLLDESRLIWSQALKQETYSDLKRIVLEEAREKDYILPRIKKEHLQRLRSLSQEMNVPYVQIALNREEDDIRYFIDYCHPIGDANSMIANKIADIILEPMSKKNNFVMKNNKASEVSQTMIEDMRLPTDHYTLF
ncbi:MAG: GDSL-type esterase/lipase family protein [Nostoc sp. DedSLP03]|uniref:SGNH/GDSL hydrolase family protein n=1 Tax=Nostoc sp. DedSLP03 TaxID=3075400 RepID=UPI002AD3EA30|nr:GDSL-type esterase/lipase family protein [Nostoc sp. DedSLP03]MDZ7964456.1 GDSL-type esterase/lipase family protein [Nostoc sp. DedSLP03]